MKSTRIPAGLLLVAAAGLLAVGPAAAQEDRRDWGVGWDDGITLRRVIEDGWEVGLAAGPNDLLSNTETVEFDSEASPEQQGLLQVPQDDKRESGWVRVEMARRLMEHGRLGIAFFTAVKFDWQNEQKMSWTWSAENPGWQVDRTDIYKHTWLVTFGLRPSYRLHERVTAGFFFGLGLSSSRRTLDTVRTYPESGQVVSQNRKDRQSGFSTEGGWSGLESLHLIFWF